MEKVEAPWIPDASPQLRSYLERFSSRVRPPAPQALDSWVGTPLAPWVAVARPMEADWGGLLLDAPPTHRLHFGPVWVAELESDDVRWPEVRDDELGALLVVGVTERAESYAVRPSGGLYRWHRAFEEVLDPVADSSLYLFEKLASVAPWWGSGAVVRREGEARPEAFAAVGAQRVEAASDSVSTHYQGSDALYVAFHRPLGRPPGLALLARDVAAAEAAAATLGRQAGAALRSRRD